MRPTEILTMLEQKLSMQWRAVAHAKRQDEYQELKAKALETYRLIKKQRTLLGAH